MKVSVLGLNKAFESRVKLGIMAALAVNDWIDFNFLKEYLEVTDGNLSTHLRALEKDNFIKVEKSFIGKKPSTKYAVTELGKKAFGDHIKALENLIKTQR